MRLEGELNWVRERRDAKQRERHDGIIECE